MTDIRSILDTLLVYYTRSRGMGHTSLAISALGHDPKALLVTLTRTHADALGAVSGVSGRVVSASSLGREVKGPIILDNYLTYHICAAALKEMHRLDEMLKSALVHSARVDMRGVYSLEEENDRLKNTLREIREVVLAHTRDIC